jgi:hypothetical protein
MGDFQSRDEVSAEDDMLLQTSLPLPQPSVFHPSQVQNYFAPAQNSRYEIENVTDPGGDLQETNGFDQDDDVSVGFRRQRNWDPNEIELLRTLCHNGATWKGIIKQLDRSRESIYTKILGEGFPTPFLARKKWTDQDRELLQTLLRSKAPVDVMKKQLGRPWSAIRNMISQEKLAGSSFENEDRIKEDQSTLENLYENETPPTEIMSQPGRPTQPLNMTPQLQHAYANRIDRSTGLSEETKAHLKILMIGHKWPQHGYRIKSLMDDPLESVHPEWSDNDDVFSMTWRNGFGLSSTTITDIFFVDRFAEECEEHLRFLHTGQHI